MCIDHRVMHTQDTTSGFKLKHQVQASPTHAIRTGTEEEMMQIYSSAPITSDHVIEWEEMEAVSAIPTSMGRGEPSGLKICRRHNAHHLFDTGFTCLEFLDFSKTWVDPTWSASIYHGDHGRLPLTFPKRFPSLLYFMGIWQCSVLMIMEDSGLRPNLTRNLSETMEVFS